MAVFFCICLLVTFMVFEDYYFILIQKQSKRDPGLVLACCILWAVFYYFKTR